MFEGVKTLLHLCELHCYYKACVHGDLVIYDANSSTWVASMLHGKCLEDRRKERKKCAEEEGVSLSL